MEKRARTYAFWVLLVFVLSGTLAPLSHGLAHAFTVEDEDSPSHRPSEVITDSVELSEIDCPLCDLLIGSSPAPQEQPARIVPRAEHLSLSSLVFPSNDHFAAPSRAPPAHV